MSLYLEEALLDAVATDNLQQVQNLLMLGANPNAGLFRDASALALTIEHENMEILDCLLRYKPNCCLTEVSIPLIETAELLPPRTWSQRLQEICQILLYTLSIDVAIFIVLFKLSSYTSGFIQDLLLLCANYSGYFRYLIIWRYRVELQ
jgi:hypothetical protein